MGRTYFVKTLFLLTIGMGVLLSFSIFLATLSNEANAANNNQSTNQPPEVSFTPIQVQTFPAVYTFEVNVTDDGQPVPPGQVRTSATFIGYGSHAVIGIGNGVTKATLGSMHILRVNNHFTLTLSSPGSLLLTVSANDGDLTTDKKWTFTVDEQNSGDIDSDGMPDEWENTFGFDPNDATDANQDADNDNLINVEEYQNSTDPIDFDTDDDLLPDGFEANGGLDPLTPTDIYADPDIDELPNFDELIHSTDPSNADTDNDGTTDGAETNQCSNPNDASDSGQAPPPDEIAKIRLTVGDHSGSHSERYNLIVGPITHQAPQFGVVATNEYCFRVGQTYSISIVHAGTNLDTPDYDYTAGVSAVDTPAGITIDDRDGILGVHNESNPFYADGKEAHLTIKAPESPTPEYGEVEVKLRAFIPCQAVDEDDPFDFLQDTMFGGDGRSFSYNNGTSRVEQIVTVSTDPLADDIRLNPEKTWVVTTTQYSEDDAVEIPDQKEDWCKGLKPGAVILDSIPQPVPDMATASRSPFEKDVVRVHLDVDVGNPFALGIYPNTTASINIYIRQESGKSPQYRIIGRHKGFPAYEIYLNKKLVYCHDPLRSGDSPYSLQPYPWNHRYIILNKWKEIDSINCEPIKGIRIHSPIGEPESQFTVTGNGFGELNANLLEPLRHSDKSVNVFINNTFLGSVLPDIEGRFQFTLNTSNASLGKYIVRVDEVSTGESYQAQFILKEDTFVVTELSDVETTFNVPSDIALAPFDVFLPVITRQ